MNRIRSKFVQYILSESPRMLEWTERIKLLFFWQIESIQMTNRTAMLVNLWFYLVHDYLLFLHLLLLWIAIEHFAKWNHIIEMFLLMHVMNTNTRVLFSDCKRAVYFFILHNDFYLCCSVSDLSTSEIYRYLQVHKWLTFLLATFYVVVI